MSHLTLFELVYQVKETLEDNLAASYWVVSEIGELRVNQKGHCYMELVEKEGAYLTAKIRANIWSNTYRNLSSWFTSVTGQQLKPGMKILAQVSVQFHELYGLSLLVTDLDPDFTLGERARKRQEVIERLQAEGVFDLNKALALPLVPQRIAVVTAPTAAGYGDFVDHLATNEDGYKFKVQLYEAVMQGDEAQSSITKALNKVYNRISEYDLLIVIRGGGSQVDLDCFDNYELARNLAQFPLPVITGIGHERDETIVDLVAHTKVKTPTAAASFLISGMSAFDERLDGYESTLSGFLLERLQEENYQLQKIGQRLQMATSNVSWRSRQQLEGLKQKLNFAGLRKLEDQKQWCRECSNYLKNQAFARVRNQEERLDHLQQTLQLLDPLEVLKRGYTMTYYKGKLLKDQIAISTGDTIETRTLTKTIKSKIEEINE